MAESSIKHAEIMECKTCQTTGIEDDFDCGHELVWSGWVEWDGDE